MRYTAVREMYHPAYLGGGRLVSTAASPSDKKRGAASVGNSNNNKPPSTPAPSSAPEPARGGGFLSIFGRPAASDKLHPRGVVFTQYHVDWRQIKRLLDAALIEMLASFFVHTVSVMHWTEPGVVQADWTIQFIPPLAWGMALLILKDEDMIFPDTTMSITLLQWALGAYKDDWARPIACIFGQLCGVGLCIGLASVQSVDLPDYTEHTHFTNTALVLLNCAATALEHLAVLYIILPLQPLLADVVVAHHRPAIMSDTAAFGGEYSPLEASKLGYDKNGRMSFNNTGAYENYYDQQQRGQETAVAPSQERLSLAAFAFAGVHWLMWKTFSSEMIPTITFAVGVLRVQKDGDHASHAWQTLGLSVAGQCIGVFLIFLYALVFLPARPTTY